jgi:glycosyltransferase involved in cell wall biosynthesis
MKILFISDAEVSLCRGSVRTVAMLYALADAGHRIDVLTPGCDLRRHPHIELPAGGEGKPVSRGRLRRAGLRAVLEDTYDAVYAVDEAVFFAARLCRWKKIPLLYDAARRFSGRDGSARSWIANLFPVYYLKTERRILRQAPIVFSSCRALTADLTALEPDARILQLEDVPAQPFHARGHAEPSSREAASSRRPGPAVVCSALPGHEPGLRTLMMAVRKVIEAAPSTLFFFRGIPAAPAQKMARNLDIADQCVFLPDDEPEPFLAALAAADAVLFLPAHGGRYIHPQVYTLLHAGAPLVTLQESAYEEVLSDKTSFRVPAGSESMAEGIIRAIQEPLFSMALGLAGQQLVADRHTFSSFKHRVRMALHDQLAG